MKVKIKYQSIKLDAVKPDLVKKCEEAIAIIERKLNNAKNDVRKADSDAMLKYILSSLQKAAGVL